MSMYLLRMREFSTYSSSGVSVHVTDVLDADRSGCVFLQITRRAISVLYLIIWILIAMVQTHWDLTHAYTNKHTHTIHLHTQQSVHNTKGK